MQTRNKHCSEDDFIARYAFILKDIWLYYPKRYQVMVSREFQDNRTQKETFLNSMKTQRRMENIYFITLDESEKRLFRLECSMSCSMRAMMKSRVIAACDRPREQYKSCHEDLLSLGVASWRRKTQKGLDDHEGFISYIEVRKDMRERGIGTSMLDFVLEDIAAEEIRTASFYTKIQNTRMQHILEKKGFEKNGYTGNGDYLCYRKAI